MTDSGDYETNRERQLALNRIIYNLQKKLKKNGEKLNNELIITIDANGNYVYTKEGKTLTRFKADVFGEANPENMTKEQSEMKADQMVEYLTGNSKFALYGEGKESYSEEELKQYGLEQEYSKEQILNIIGIRYMLSLNSYRKYQSITIARDISQETVAYVMENNRMLTGVDIKEDWERIKKDAVEKNDAIYAMWEKTGEISLKELLYYGIEKRWINLDMVPLNSEYITQDELYKELVHEIHNQLEISVEIEKTMFHNLLLNDEITGKEVCELLYDQNILSKEDGDYQKLIDGKIDAYTFIKKKIENLEITPAQLALDPCSGSAVVIQAETGDVLACVTYPGYDNNRLANQLDSEYYYQLLSDKSLPLYNKATQQLTAPGSTLKPVTVAAGMEEGIISFDTSVLCNGVFDKVNPKLNCWKHTGHGKIPNAAAAIQNSCNDYLCEISYRLGMKETGVYDDNKALVSLQKYAKLFDLDKKSGIEIAESNPHVTGNYAIPSAIGQGTHNYATVQLARYTNTVATKGNSFSLTMIKGIEDKSGNWKKSSPVLESKVELRENVWDTLEAGMSQFAQNNDFLKEMKINVAGKTGTAQEAKNRPDHALFIGYAPIKNPEISIAVRIANGYVSSNATQVGRDIFNFYFDLESKDKILTGKASQTYNNRTD